MTVLLIGHDFGYKMEHTVRMFLPERKVVLSRDKSATSGDRITTRVDRQNSGIALSAAAELEGFSGLKTVTIQADSTNSTISWELCRLLFSLMVEYTGMRPPWGVLTGVRPLKQVALLKKQGLSTSEVISYFTKYYMASPDKAELAVKTYEHQLPILSSFKKDSFSLYVSIPFCPSRCRYCSFISENLEKSREILPDYLDRLAKEISHTGQLTRELGMVLDSIYIGGGTPTILSADQLATLFSCIEKSFDTARVREYTLEAGRADTIDAAKLSVARSYGVDRVSVNPQTLNEEVLLKTGRGHSVAEFYSAFSLAQNIGFKTINADLILGLEGESGGSFLSGVAELIRLGAENITIHTLTIKKASTLAKSAIEYSGKAELAETLKNSRELLTAGGYNPYYLYRQKGTLENQENVGYSLVDNYGIYNVAMMEEMQTTIGVGAGATTRLLYTGGEMSRSYNYKYPFEYLDRFQQVLERKNVVRRNYERNRSN